MPDLSHLRVALGVEGFINQEGYFGPGPKGNAKGIVSLDPRHWTHVRQAQDRPYSTDSNKKYKVSARRKELPEIQRPQLLMGLIRQAVLSIAETTVSWKR